MEDDKITKKLKWCFKIKDGLQIVEPNNRLSESYLEEAKSSLARAEKNFQDGDLLWSTIVIYYSEYYALYSFLQRIGAKCENHACSILAVKFLLGEEKTKTIDEHKEKRIDAQYYMRVGKKEQVERMLQEAKEFVSIFDEMVSNVNEEEIKSYRGKLKAIK
ncbi:MAG: HEPN domain-containing protein [Candidatus Aenigmarchaeota archaeon]|nr:HEPN domain-containing protein [Candidatus Aenigmarchaeota archaeon]